MKRRLAAATQTAALQLWLLSVAAEEACNIPAGRALYPATRYGREGEGPGEVNTPFHAVAAGDLVFVSDFWNHRIQVFSHEGEARATIGSKGTELGLLMFPMGMAVSGDTLFVCEGLNHRVQMLTLAGDPIGSFGQQGTGDGQMNYPPAIALSDTAAFVTDGANERVVVFELRSGRFLRAIGSNATFRGVMGVAFDAGELFVSDRDRVQVFDADGSLLRRLHGPAWAHVVGVAVRGQELYASVGGADSGVRIFDRATGELLGAAHLPGGSATASLISADERGLLAADGERHFVQRLLMEPPRPLLTEASRFGSFGSAEGEVNYPYQAVAGAHSGDIFVADQFNHRISVFSANGAFVRAFASKGSGAGQFMYPMGLTVHGDEVLVADGAGRRIQVFGQDGGFRREFGHAHSVAGALQDPLGLVVGGGHTYVVDYGFDCVQVYDGAGRFVRKWGSQGSEPGHFDNPCGIAWHGGSIFVTDRNRVQRFASSGALQGEFRSLKLAGATGIAATADRVFVSGSVKGVGFVRVFSHEGVFLGEHTPPEYTRLGLASTNGTHVLVTDELAHRVYCLAIGM